VRETLRAELTARDPGRERVLQLRAAGWFESAGDARRAARHFMSARQSHRALALLRDKSIADFLRDPVQPAPLDVSEIRPEAIMDAPDELLALATDLLLSGDIAHGGQYLDLFEQIPSARLEPALEARLAVARAFRFTTTGRLARALGTAMRARVIQGKAQLGDEWTTAVSLILLSVYPCLEIPDAVEREAATTLKMPALDEPARLVLVPGARALALVESGHLAEGADAAEAAEADAVRLGFGRHFFAVDHLRALAGLALERRDLDTAEHLTEQVLSISQQWPPLFEFLALLDRAKIWAARGRVCEALATIESARQILEEPSTALVARADEQEAVLRLSLGDPRSPAELAGRLPPGARRSASFSTCRQGPTRR
jgi:tetratricopeptide (TPR) repeat protein